MHITNRRFHAGESCGPRVHSGLLHDKCENCIEVINNSAFFCSINLSTEVDICRKLNAFLRLDKLCEYKVLFSLVILLLIY